MAHDFRNVNFGQLYIAQTGINTHSAVKKEDLMKTWINKNRIRECSDSIPGGGKSLIYLFVSFLFVYIIIIFFIMYLPIS